MRFWNESKTSLSEKVVRSAELPATYTPTFSEYLKLWLTARSEDAVEAARAYRTTLYHRVDETQLSFGTLFIGSLLISTFIGTYLCDPPPFHMFCSSFYTIVTEYEVQRLFTYAFCHGGLLDTIFNVVILFQVNSLEKRFGTLQFFHVILLLCPFVSCMQLFVSRLLSYFRKKEIYRCALGFQAVNFALLVIESNLCGIEKRHLLGLVEISAVFYPLLLAALFELLMPSWGVNVLYNLCGVVAGMLYANTGLHKLLSLSPWAAEAFQHCLGPIERLESFVSIRTVAHDSWITRYDAESAPPPALQHSLSNPVPMLWASKHVIEPEDPGKLNSQALRSIDLQRKSWTSPLQKLRLIGDSVP